MPDRHQQSGSRRLEPPMRIRAYHRETGSILTGVVTEAAGDPPQRSFRFIADGLLEEVVLREGPWSIAEIPDV